GRRRDEAPVRDGRQPAIPARLDSARLFFGPRPRGFRRRRYVAVEQVGGEHVAEVFFDGGFGRGEAVPLGAGGDRVGAGGVERGPGAGQRARAVGVHGGGLADEVEVARERVVREVDRRAAFGAGGEAGSEESVGRQPAAALVRQHTREAEALSVGRAERAALYEVARGPPPEAGE